MSPIRLGRSRRSSRHRRSPRHGDWRFDPDTGARFRLDLEQEPPLAVPAPPLGGWRSPLIFTPRGLGFVWASPGFLGVALLRSDLDHLPVLAWQSRRGRWHSHTHRLSPRAAGVLRRLLPCLFAGLGLWWLSYHQATQPGVVWFN